MPICCQVTNNTSFRDGSSHLNHPARYHASLSYSTAWENQSRLRIIFGRTPKSRRCRRGRTCAWSSACSTSPTTAGTHTWSLTTYPSSSPSRPAGPRGYWAGSLSTTVRVAALGRARSIPRGLDLTRAILIDRRTVPGGRCRMRLDWVEWLT